MAHQGEMHAPVIQSRVPIVQKWLTRLLIICPCTALGVLIVGSRPAPYLSLVLFWPIMAAGVGVSSIGEGMIVCLFPDRATGAWRRSIERVRWPRLMGILLIWLGIWCGGTFLILGFSVASIRQTPDDVFIIGNAVALAPLTVLEIVAWVRHRPERRRARADAAQDRAAWMMMNMRAATTEQTTGHESSRWRDRWRNRVRRAQHRRTRG